MPKSALPRSLAALAATGATFCLTAAFVLAGLATDLQTTVSDQVHQAVTVPGLQRLADHALGGVAENIVMFRWLVVAGLVFALLALPPVLRARPGSRWPAWVWFAAAVAVCLPTAILGPWAIVGVPLAATFVTAAGIHSSRRRRWLGLGRSGFFAFAFDLADGEVEL